MFNILKAEYEMCRELWAAQAGRLRQLGELSVATARIRHRAEGERVPPEEAHFKVAPGTEDTLIANYDVRVREAEKELGRHSRHLKFLMSQCIKSSDQCNVCLGPIGACGGIALPAWVEWSLRRPPPSAQGRTQRCIGLGGALAFVTRGRAAPSPLLPDRRAQLERFAKRLGAVTAA